MANREKGLRLGAVSTRSLHRRGTIDLNHARKENLNDLSPLNKFWQAHTTHNANQRTSNTSSKTVKSLRHYDPDASRTVRRKSTVERLKSDNGALLTLYTNTREASNKQLEQCCCVCSCLLHTYAFHHRQKFKRFKKDSELFATCIKTAKSQKFYKMPSRIRKRGRLKKKLRHFRKSLVG